jgi:hypothetical protein
MCKIAHPPRLGCGKTTTQYHAGREKRLIMPAGTIPTRAEKRREEASAGGLAREFVGTPVRDN